MTEIEVKLYFVFTLNLLFIFFTISIVSSDMTWSLYYLVKKGVDSHYQRPCCLRIHISIQGGATWSTGRQGWWISTETHLTTSGLLHPGFRQTTHIFCTMDGIPSSHLSTHNPDSLPNTTWDADNLHASLPFSSLNSGAFFFSENVEQIEKYYHKKIKNLPVEGP